MVAAEQGHIEPGVLEGLARLWALDEEEFRGGKVAPIERVEGIGGATVFLLHGTYQDFDARDLGALERAMRAGRSLTAHMAAAGEVERLCRRIQFVPTPPAGPRPADAARQGYKLARHARAKLLLGGEPIGDIRVLLEEQLGIAVLVDHLVTKHLCAASICDAHGAAAAAVLEEDDADRHENPALTRVYLAHELCHLLFDPGAPGGIRLALDDRPDESSSPRTSTNTLLESRAKGFAAEFLIPFEGLQRLLRPPKEITDFQEAQAMVAKVRDHFSTPWEIAAYHLNNVRFIARSLSLSLRKNKLPAPPNQLATSLPAARGTPLLLDALRASGRTPDPSFGMSPSREVDETYARPAYVDEARSTTAAARDDSSSRVLKEALALCAAGRDIAAVDLLVDHLDDLFDAGEFQVARRALELLDPHKLTPKVLTGVLMVSDHMREQLGEARARFFERVRSALADTWSLDPERIERVTQRWG
ncbi:ImmA/IrrE family metallo-endopeptidase [Chondromyces apiculatus]|uniref:IrrE N-terminal-like domain-containing protein n=1 Tax=Chondromyces apiculatus DSM 436 TaxID=1192034 RepID=A0A017TAQ9_9BACT|nr:ImmA/IrrE family metallo-endopeptidase [Chondromyces apiculatus]EYF05910.1 Hypothetical protein CAP_2912 [Chondromyces apiculatus DSM 436]